MAKTEKGAKVPNLRFPGFEGEWEFRTLREIAKLITKGTTPSRFVDQGIKFIKIECFVGDKIDGQKCLFIDEHTHNKELKRSVLQENDLLFAIAGATIGKVNIVQSDILPANTNQALAIIRLQEHEDSKFIYQILKSEIMRKYIKDTISVGAQPNLNLEQINDFSFFQPKIIEQQKIASFLSLLDLRIQIQSKIIEKLETLIKGISENLFNQKLRFADFLEDWNIYRVSDFLEFFSTNSLSWENLEYGRSTFFNLHYGLIHQGLPLHIDIKKCCLPGIKSDSLPKNYTLCKDGDIAFADASEDTTDVAKVVEFINCDNKKIVCGLHTIHARDKLNLTVTGFKGFAFLSKHFRNQIRALAQGTKVFAVSSKSFNECFINIPSKNEQLKITRILCLINNKIDTEKKLLLHLQQQKNHLVRNLFI